MTTRRDNSYWRTKHERILEAAFEEFGQFGFELASMDKIAETAGVSKVTVYNHFETKDKLFIASFGHFFEFTFKPFALEGPSTDLSHVVESIVKHLQTPEHLAMLKLLRTEQNRCRLLGVERSESEIYSQDLISVLGLALSFAREKSAAVGEVIFSLIQKTINDRITGIDSDAASTKTTAKIMTVLAAAGLLPA